MNNNDVAPGSARNASQNRGDALTKATAESSGQLQRIYDTQYSGFSGAVLPVLAKALPPRPSRRRLKAPRANRHANAGFVAVSVVTKPLTG